MTKPAKRDQDNELGSRSKSPPDTRLPLRGSCFLGLDLGTTKTAAVVIDSATGATLTGSTQSTEPARLASSLPGASEWNLRQLAEIAFATGRQAIASLDDPRRVRGIGVTGQMHGLALIDSSDLGGYAPLLPFIGWQDQRCEAPAGGHPSTIAWMRALAGGSASRTGCQLATGYLGSTLFWLDRQDRGEIRPSLAPPGRQAKAGQPAHGTGKGRLITPPALACFLPDYVVGQLTGQPPITDLTNAASSGLFDIAAGRWDSELIGRLGLAATVLPLVQPTGSIVGGLTPLAAARLGLPSGVPVLNGIGDNQASFFGSVSSPRTDLLVNIGTGGQVSATIGRPVIVPGIDTRPYVAGDYLLVGSELTGGSAYALLRDFFRQVTESTGGKPVEDVYSILNRLAAETPAGSRGLRIDPRFLGTRADPGRRAAITGLGVDNFTPGHFARAVLEGMSATYRELAVSMLAAGLAPRRRLIGSGNGIRHNPVLVECLEREFGLPIVTPADTEEAARGAALLAAVGVGAVPSQAAAGALIQYQSAMSAAKG